MRKKKGMVLYKLAFTMTHVILMLVGIFIASTVFYASNVIVKIFETYDLIERNQELSNVTREIVINETNYIEGIMNEQHDILYDKIINISKNTSESNDQQLLLLREIMDNINKTVLVSSDFIIENRNTSTDNNKMLKEIYDELLNQR